MSTQGSPSPGGPKPAASKAADIYNTIDKGFKPIDEAAKWTTRWGFICMVIAIVGPLVSAAIVWFSNEAVSYFHVLGITAPLTIAVMVLVPIYRSARMGGAGYLITTTIVLAVAVLLSHLFGPAIEWNFPTGITMPLYILDAFFRVYHIGPFFVSVVTGLIAGFLLSQKVDLSGL